MARATDLMLNGNRYKIGSPTYDVDFLLVGGGGAGGRHRPDTNGTGGGGGAGGVIEKTGYKLSTGSHCIVIGAGECYSDLDHTTGGNSCFTSFVALGGGKGGGTYCSSAAGYSGGSGGGGTCYDVGGTGVQGCAGGHGCDFRFAGGGGGFTSAGLQPPYDKYSTTRTGGIGLQSDISGTMQYYAYGGSGGGCYCGSCGGTSPGGGGKGGGCNFYATSPTSCGSGGGGAGWCYNSCPTNGAGGIFILRYPSSCGYDITGGTKYLCNGYCIHCFTSNGTLTVS